MAVQHMQQTKSVKENTAWFCPGVAGEQAWRERFMVKVERSSSRQM